MTESRRRGVCPGLSAPMATGDGLLVRLAPASPVPLDAMAGLCTAARDHGNGTIEVTARGSVQVRGLTPHAAPLFATAVADLGIAVQEGVPVIAGLDDRNADLLAAELRRTIADARLALSPKVSVVVDGDGPLHLDRLSADVRLRTAGSGSGMQSSTPRCYLGIASDEPAGTTWLGTVARTNAVSAVMDILRTIASQGPAARAADVFGRDGGAAFRAAAGGGPVLAPPHRTPAEMIGYHSLRDGSIALGIGLSFGHARADELAELVRAAGHHGARAVRPAPDRTVLLTGMSAQGACDLAAFAERRGFVVHPGDPRRRIAACPGLPACASGLIPARTLAEKLVSMLSAAASSRGDRASRDSLPSCGEGMGWGVVQGGSAAPNLPTPAPIPSADVGGGEFAALSSHIAHVTRGVAVHISGCPKGCAHPAAAPLTIVGAPEGCGVIYRDTARATPHHYADPARLAGEILAAASQSVEAAHG